MRKTTLIIDGSNLIFRCLLQEGLGWLCAKDGRSTGATCGTITIIRKMLRENADVVSVVFVQDGGISKRRLELFPEYKAKRRASTERAKAIIEAGLTEDGDPLPTWKDRWQTTVAGKMRKVDLDEPIWRAALRRAFTENSDDLRAILPSLGIRLAQLRGREADDVVARIAKDRSMSGEHALVVSEDKDFIQLVSDRVTLYRPIADQLYNMNTLHTYIPVPQWFYLIARAMDGDDSDEIPGVRGVGEKTVVRVAELLTTHFEKQHAQNAVDFWSNAEDIYAAITTVCREFIGDKREAGRILKVVEGVDIIKRNVALMNLAIESDSLRADEEDKLYAAMEEPIAVSAERACSKLRTIDAAAMAGDLSASNCQDFGVLEA